MHLFAQSWTYALSHREQLTQALGEHLLLVMIPLGISMLVGLPLGFWSAKSSGLPTLLLNGINALRVIPSLAILFILIPYTGLTWLSAAIALTLLSLPPILLNTHSGFRSIRSTLIEAAQGLGMNPLQVLWQVEIPLALPVILAGIKTAALEVIASATLAAFIGAGGLGTFITLGFALYDNSILLVGAIPVAMLALAAEVGLSGLAAIAGGYSAFRPHRLRHRQVSSDNR